MKSKQARLLEEDLYPPLKNWLEKNGYEVRAEVGGCDVAARRGDELVLIEMKLSLNLDLFLQVARRQKAAEAVYAAVPAPKSMRDRRWRELTALLKRLEVGLILVFMQSPSKRVAVAFHPIAQSRRVSKARSKSFLTEMEGRSLDLNTGGTNRRKLMTAYREQAVLVAAALAKLGPCSPKALKDNGAPPKAGAILRDNHYGWFERIERGLYGLSAEGRLALVEYKDITDGGEA